MVSFKIENREIGDNQPCFIVAEAGVNHNGDFEIAKKLVDVAVESKADAIKFQFLTAKGLYVKDAGKFTTEWGKEVDIYDIWKDVELQNSWVSELYNYCKNKEIIFFASVFEKGLVDVMDDYVDVYKIASYEITDIPLLKKIASKRKPVVFSIGGAGMEEVREAVKTLKDDGINDITIMQCVAKYPTPLELANVNVIETLKKEFPDIVIGYSDHSLDPVTVPIAAVVKGAKMIEKHFTLSRDMEGIDHKMSIEPDELEKMINAIRKTEEEMRNNEHIVIDEKVLGDGNVRLTEEQKGLLKFTRRKIFAIEDIKKGDYFTEKNVSVLRPGNKDIEGGLHPREYFRILNSKANQNISKFSLIRDECIEK